MATVVDQHRSHSPQSVRVAVLTVSDTRTEATDTSGRRIVELLEAAGHALVDRQIVPDGIGSIREWAIGHRDGGGIDAALITGGTGISPRDVTIEALEPLWTKSIPGFGELFRMLSHAEIGPAALMSRAEAGLIGSMVVFALPGSQAGVELAMTRIIIPELPHLVGQARKV